VAAVLAGREQATYAVPPHVAERHRADWFVVPGHAASKEQIGNIIQVRSLQVIFALAIRDREGQRPAVVMKKEDAFLDLESLQETIGRLG
jgi:hypothetical protein